MKTFLRLVWRMKRHCAGVKKGRDDCGRCEYTALCDYFIITPSAIRMNHLKKILEKLK